MKVVPTPEQWALLTPVERINFRMMDFVNRTPLRRLLSWPKWTLGMAWVELVISNLAIAHHFERFQNIDPSRGVLLVANHRSFFDLYAVSARLFRLYGNHHYICFPVRSSFFYTSPFGALVNLPVGQCSMYPPILRDKERREWNRFCQDLMVEMLQDPSVMIGFHPEGTRNQGPDPYALLRGRQGCGELIYRARPNVVPVFLQGFPRYAWPGIWLNRLPKRMRPVYVHMVMGEPMEFTSELSLPPGPETYQQIVDKVMSHIAALGREERSLREQDRQDGIPLLRSA